MPKRENRDYLIKQMDNLYIYRNGNIKKVKTVVEPLLSLKNGQCLNVNSITEKENNRFLYILDDRRILISKKRLTSEELSEITIETGGQISLANEDYDYSFLDKDNDFSTGIKVLDFNRNRQISIDIKLVLSSLKKERIFCGSKMLPKDSDISEYHKHYLIDSLLKWQRNYLFRVDHTGDSLRQIPLRVVSDTKNSIYVGENICTPALEAMQSNISTILSKITKRKLYCIYTVEDYFNMIGINSDFQQRRLEKFENIETTGRNFAKVYKWNPKNVYYSIEFNDQLKLFRVYAFSKGENKYTRFHTGPDKNKLLNLTSLDVFGNFYMNGKYECTINKQVTKKSVAHSYYEYSIEGLNSLGFHILECV